MARPGPRLKLCEECDQVSFVRGDARARRRDRRIPRLRCWAPRSEGGYCPSRRVRTVTLDALNEHHTLEKAAWRAELDRHEAAIRELDAARGNQEARLRDVEDLLRDLARRIEDAEGRARVAEERRQEAERRADDLERRLMRRGLRPEDLR